MRRRSILLLLLLSGFAGLAYELLWVRLLALSLGSTTLSFSTVLAVFFGGLALGSRWAGKRLHKSERPILTYAVLEGATGILGLLLYPLMKHLGSVFALIDPGTGFAGIAARFIVSALILLPPTFLMGATLPYICLGTIEKDDDTGRGTALIYGVNTLGACLGAYSVTFLLLPNFGIFKSTLVVASVNFLVAAIAYVMAKRSNGDGAASPESTTEAAPLTDDEKKRALLVTVTAFVGGLVATGAQIVWGRFFSTTLRGTVYGYGSVLVSVLVGIALGSLLAARLAKSSKNLLLTLGAVELAVLLGLASFGPFVTVFDYLALTFSTSGCAPLTTAHIERALVWVTLSLPTIASGAVLPLLVAFVEHSARGAGTTLSKLYAANTAGCIIGSLGIGYVLLPQLGSNSTMYALLVLLAATVAILLLILGKSERIKTSLLAVAGLGVVAAFPAFDARLNQNKVDARGNFFVVQKQREMGLKDVAYFHEGDIATVRVTKNQGTSGLSLNGLGQGGRSALPPNIIFESLLVATVPFGHAAHHDKGLVIGLGAGGTVEALKVLGTKQLDVCELERGVIDAQDVIWGAASPLKRDGVNLILNDARHHLLVQARKNPKSYDFITSMPAHPWIASALFTEDFFHIAAENLKDDGIFSTWFGVGNMDARAVESLFGAFTSAFRHFVVYWVPESGAYYVVGSKSNFAVDTERLTAMGQSPVFDGYGDNIRSPNFLLSRVAASSPAGGYQATGFDVNTDDNALIEFRAALPPVNLKEVDHLRFMPLRALDASRLKAVNAVQLRSEIIETIFQTPDARLPHTQRLAPAARRHLDAIAQRSDPSTKAYIQTRLALLDNKRDDAKRLLASVTEVAQHAAAAKFIAATEANEAIRVDALKSLSISPDIEATLAALKQPSRYSTSPPAAQKDDDALQWLFTNEPISNGEPKTEIARKVFERLRQMNSPALFQKGQAFAAANQLSWLAQECEAGVFQATRAEANRALQEGLRFGGNGKFAEALSAMWKAQSLAPLDQSSLQLLLRTALRANDTVKLLATKEQLLMRGMQPQTLAALESTYRQQNADEAKGNASFKDESQRLEAESKDKEVKPMAEPGSAQEALP